MPLFKCEWPNGDVSFVLATHAQDAIARLDEFGAAEPKMLRPISEFLIDLRPNRKLLEANQRARHKAQPDQNGQPDQEEAGWPWELNEIGECLLDPESEVLPSEEKTLRRLRRFEAEANASANTNADARSQKREQALRARAIRDGSLVDLAAQRRARAIRRPTSLEPVEPADEP